MPGMVVVNGARLHCTRLSICAESALVVSPTMLAPEVEGQPVATILDHVAGENILPFPGDCLTTKKPCKPDTPLPWASGESSVLLPDLAPLVSQSAILSCVHGCGQIRITSPGQSTLDVDAATGEDEGGGFSISAAFGAAIGALGKGARSVARTAPSLAGEAAALAPRVAGGVAGAIVGPLIFPEETSPDDVIVQAKKSRASGREKGNDISPWQREVLAEKPVRADEKPAEAADRVMRERFPEGDYPKGAGSEHNKLQKYISRGGKNR